MPYKGRTDQLRLSQKRQEQEITELINKITALENGHQQSLSTQSVTELLETRKALQQIIEHKTKSLLFFKKAIYYESGDKTGRLLSRALKETTIKKPHSRDQMAERDLRGYHRS